MCLLAVCVLYVVGLLTFLLYVGHFPLLDFLKCCEYCFVSLLGWVPWFGWIGFG